MKTDDLICMLSTNVEPVDHRQVARTIRTALAFAGAGVVLAVLVTLGIRGDATDINALPGLLLKLAFTLAALFVASNYLIKLCRPGGERQTSIGLLMLLFLAVMLLAAISLAFAPSSHWNRMVLGNQWLECLISIPLIAVVPFAATVWAVRQTAPTDLSRAGAIAGLVAGCLSAAGYALHCADDSAPFVALWYGGTISLCTFAGWKLGPRFLRW